MNENMLLYLMMGVGALFLVIIVAYLIIKNRNQNSEIAQIRKQLNKINAVKTENLLVNRLLK